MARAYRSWEAEVNEVAVRAFYFLLGCLVAAAIASITVVLIDSRDAGEATTSVRSEGHTVEIGWTDSDRSLAYLAFYPRETRIHPGDSVTFHAHANHTLTFVSAQDQPEFERPERGIVPIGAAPCITRQKVTAAST